MGVNGQKSYPAVAVGPASQPDSALDNVALLRHIFRLLGVFCGSLVVVELGSDIFAWGHRLDAMLRLSLFCAFIVAFAYYARHWTQTDKRKLLVHLFLVCVFIAFLTDVTKYVDPLNSFPVLGRDSPRRRDVQSLAIMLAISCLTIGSYFILMETLRVKTRLQLELENLQRAEVALRESEERFRRIFEDGPLGMVMVGADQRILRANAAFSQMVGYSESELSSLTLADITHPDYIVEQDARIKQLFTGQLPVYRAARRFLPKNQVAVWAAVTGSVIRNARGEILYYLGMVEDITERKHLEDQLRVARQIEAIGRLAGGVAHDFFNLLLIIQGNCTVSLNENKANPALVESLEAIAEAAARANNLVRQLLMFNRRQVVQLRPLDLNAVISHMLKLLRHMLGKEVVLDFQAQPDLPWIQADTSMMEQVIMNLSVNARDAMPSGGKLTITTKLVDVNSDAGAANSGARPGQFACLIVADTGLGMDETVRHRLFELFFTTKEAGRGTGLGLATVAGIIKQLGGWIEVQSALGEGSTFKVFLPSVAAGASAPVVRPPQPAIRGGHETILLVEAERAVRRVIGQNLRSHGYQVLEAANPAETLFVWGKHGAQVDLLFLGNPAADGSARLKLAEQLRQQQPNLKVVMTSGGEPDVPAASHPQPGLAFLTEPHDLPALAHTVRRCLDQAG